MKILMNICCGPCSIYPVKVLRDQGHELMGSFYRHNIHPFTECMRREDTLREYAASQDLRMIWQQDYEMEEFLRNVAFREADRCRYCYHSRLKATAMIAKKGKFDAFTTTLLYSKFQKHGLIREIGEALGKQYSVPFYYHDFREGWKHGIEESKRLGMYRQQYCGCIYSEKDRFYNPKQNQEAG
ncbi:MAG: epoxyqueuosine reductase QueH [Desulfatibacillum sp.]|nr:epoxyqueuosine reductase QueH [Desulfatibacillum sp.]